MTEVFFLLTIFLVGFLLGLLREKTMSFPLSYQGESGTPTVPLSGKLCRIPLECASVMKISGPYDVEIDTDEKDPYILLDESLFPFFRMIREGDSLSLGFSPHIVQEVKKIPVIQLQGVSQNITFLSLSGTGDKTAHLSLRNPLKCEISGTGDSRIDIQGPQVTLGISGTGDNDLVIRSDLVDISQSGAGDSILTIKAKDFCLNGSGVCGFTLQGEIQHPASVSITGCFTLIDKTRPKVTYRSLLQAGNSEYKRV